MDTTIRPGRSEDIPRLCGLLRDLFSIEKDFTPDIVRQEQGLSMLIADGSGRSRVLVAVAGSTVIGMATVQVLVSTAEGGRVGFIEDVVVDGRFRCRNVGTALLDGITAWGREQGLKRLQLLADRENHQALNFYSSRGWSRTNLHCLRMHL